MNQHRHFCISDLYLHSLLYSKPRHTKRLFERYHTVENMWKLPNATLAKELRMEEEKLQALKSDIQKQGDSFRADKLQKDVALVSYADEAYPKALRKIYDPPAFLWMQHSSSFSPQKCVAIVGSRRASKWALDYTYRLSLELSRRGVCVVSGLAYGVDVAAHKAALYAEASTVAVLGSGLKRIYPTAHLPLAEEIVQKGAVLSEFPLEMIANPWQFPQRNRIVSALSVGVIIIEAAKKSGSLITADFALQQGKEVMVAPGRAGEQECAGSNALLRDGAILIESADDVFEALGWENEQCFEKSDIKRDQHSFQPLFTVEDFAVREKLALHQASLVLMEKVLAGEIEECPGGLFRCK